ncbi:MAG TPA: class I SAM-dependent methyltransferase [Longimicrobiaceae bacterium]|nr:class I SAM-dependent methyltransferase [Longimicrobiaceae bacterium]
MSALAADPLDALVACLRAERFRGPALAARVGKAFGVDPEAVSADPDTGVFLHTLYAAVRTLKPQVVVQTGTWVGFSTVAIALGLEDNGSGVLHTIDPEPALYFGVRDPVSKARGAVSAAGLAGRVRFVAGYSTIPGDGDRMDLPERPNWRLRHLARAENGFDLLVIDGDHTFNGCLLDLVVGAAGLAPDGPRLVVVHDYSGIPAVRRAVKVWCASRADVRLRVVPCRCGIALLHCP